MKNPDTFHASMLAEVTKSTDFSKWFLGSPSILKLPSGTILVSCDMFSYKKDPENYAQTFVYADTGAGFGLRLRIDGLFWANLFLHNGDVYLFGTNEPHGAIVIMKSSDEGKTFSTPIDEQTGLLFKKGGVPCDGLGGLLEYHCAPVPVAYKNGHIYRAFERKSTFDYFPGLYSFVISCDASKDLLQASNWKMSQENKRDDCLEGNVIAHTDGNIYNLLRVHRTNTAALYKLADDDNAYSFVQEVQMPGGDVKFTVRRDEQSGVYIALVNLHTDIAAESNLQRNVLGLIFSENLLEWTVGHILIQETASENWQHSLKKIGFQYVDWIFDNKNILLAVRSSYNGADTFHNANRITLHHLQDYRQYLQPMRQICDYRFSGNLDDSSPIQNHLRGRAGACKEVSFAKDKSGMIFDGGYLDANFLLGNSLANCQSFQLETSVLAAPNDNLTRKEYLFSLCSGDEYLFAVWLSWNQGEATLFVSARSTPMESGITQYAANIKALCDTQMDINIRVSYSTQKIDILINGEKVKTHQTGCFISDSLKRAAPKFSDKIGADMCGENTFKGDMSFFRIKLT